MNYKLGWDTAVSAAERLVVENAQLQTENARLKVRIIELEKYVLPKQEGLHGDTTDGPI